MGLNVRKERGALLIALCMILLISGLISSVLGGTILIGGDMVIDAVKDTSEYKELVKTLSLSDMTEAQISSAISVVLRILGLALLFPGLMSLVSGIMGLINQGYILGMITWAMYTLLSVALLFSGNFLYIIGVLAGILCMFLWYKCKFRLSG